MSRAISRGLASTGMHVQAGQRVQFVEGVDVERVAGGDDQRAVVPRDRHQVLAMHELAAASLRARPA